MSALTALGLFFPGIAFGQVILDDFSANNESKYAFAPVFPFNASDGWAVTGGELRPSMGENSSATWLWNQGEKLSAAGDSVSIRLSLSGDAENGFASSIGLFVAVDTSLDQGHFVSLTKNAGSIFGYSVDGDISQQSAPPSGPILLTIQRTGEQTTEGVRYNTTFSGGGLPTQTSFFFTDKTDPLRFGPFAENTAGTLAALDNLTFTAVPEPAMYTAVFGFLALTTAVIRRRTARRS